jgi:hypothetical protein
LVYGIWGLTILLTSLTGDSYTSVVPNASVCFQIYKAIYGIQILVQRFLDPAHNFHPVAVFFVISANFTPTPWVYSIS